MATFAEVTENECINEKHPLFKGDNLTNTAR